MFFGYTPCLIKQRIVFSSTNAMSFPMQPQTPSSDTSGVLVKVFFRHIYMSMVLWFFQVVHLTHEWMEEKLQTYFRMDTGCLNHNTSMKNCKFSLLTLSLSSYRGTFFKSLTDHLNNTRYQIMMKCWKNDPDARPTFTELKNQLKDMETLHKVRILIKIKYLSTWDRLA